MGKTILLVIILLVTVYSVWKGWRLLSGPDDADSEEMTAAPTNKEEKHG